MDSLIVKEFEIINEEKLRSVIPNYTNQFNELLDFLEEYSASSVCEDPYNFLAVKKNREYGTYVTFKNYVGLIQLKSGFQIEILPKVDLAPTNGDIKKVFLRMLKSMKDFEGKVFNISDLSLDSMNLYEIFINMYLQQVTRLVKHGLKSAYITVSDNLPYAKGKLIVKEQIRKNLAHKERMYESYDEYNLNRPENKLIKSTLNKLLIISNNDGNRKMCKQILSYFGNISPSVNYDYDFECVNLDRSMQEYELILRWSKAFLKNKSFTTFSGDEKARALLFPMEKLFESFVAKYVKDIFSEYGWDVSAQDQGLYLFNQPDDKFALRPDLVVTKNDGTIIILDTKWKNLFDDASKNYGISQADMYQMYAYSKKYNAPKIWLLYPNNKEMDKHANIQFTSADNVEVNVFFVDLLNIDSSIASLRNIVK